MGSCRAVFPSSVRMMRHFHRVFYSLIFGVAYSDTCTMRASLLAGAVAAVLPVVSGYGASSLRVLCWKFLLRLVGNK